jgi:hypothetical protein
MSIHSGSEKRRSPTLEARPLLFEAYHPYVEIVVGTDLGRGNAASPRDEHYGPQAPKYVCAFSSMSGKRRSPVDVLSATQIGPSRTPKVELMQTSRIRNICTSLRQHVLCRQSRRVMVLPPCRPASLHAASSDVEELPMGSLKVGVGNRPAVGVRVVQPSSAPVAAAFKARLIEAFPQAGL